MVQKYSSAKELLPVANDYVHWETQQPQQRRRACAAPPGQTPASSPEESASVGIEQRALASGGAMQPEPELAPASAPTERPGRHIKARQTVPAAEVMRRLDAVQTRIKDRRSARPGEAAALFADVVDALAVAADDFSADEVSRVYSLVEAALQRVYDDCTPDAAVVLLQQQLNAELVVEQCASIGLSANQRGKLRKWAGRLVALARDIEEREHRAATEVYRPLPAVLSQRLGSEMFALFLHRLPDSATTAAQKEIVSRIDRAVRTRTGHPDGAVHVFGSAASGFGGSGSDVDLCAELPKEQAKTNQLYASLRQHKARLAEIEAQFPELPRRAARRKELTKEIGTMDGKLSRLKREIQQEKTCIMQRATAISTQIESIRRTVIVKLVAPPATEDHTAAGKEPATARARKKSNRRGANEISPSQEELEELKNLMLSDELGPWPLVSSARPPEWGVSIVAPPTQAFRTAARIEFNRLDDMNAALAASKSGSIVLGSSGQRVNLRGVRLRAAPVQEAEAAQRGEVRPTGRLHDAELALNTTAQRLDAAMLALEELNQEEAGSDSSSVQIAAAAETEKLVQQCTRWIGDLEKQGKITYMFRGVMQHQGFSEVQAIANAAVPIVKMIDARGSGLHVDICFNNMLGVVNTRLLKTYSELGWYVRPLVLTVKHWAKRRKINDASSGTLSSYAYVIMVIHFLQTQGLLPDLQADELWESEGTASAGVRRPAVFDPVSGFNMAFAEAPYAQQCSSRGALEGQHRNSVQVATAAADKDAQFLGELLSRFFHYYARELRWWKDAISIHRVGVSYAKAASAAFFSPTSVCTDAAAVAAPTLAPSAPPAGGQTIDKSEAWEAMQYAPWMPRYDNGVQLPKLWRLGVIDPFEYTHDLGVVLSESGMAALNRELSRAAAIICDAAGAEALDDNQAVSDLVTEHMERNTNEQNQDEKQLEQVVSVSKVWYNTRLARWEVKGLEGVKKVKEINVELLCEEETSKLVARKLGLAEERLRALRLTQATTQDDAKAKTTSSSAAAVEQLGLIAALEQEVLLLKSRKDTLAKSEKQQQNQQQKAQAVAAQQRRNDRFVVDHPNRGPGRTQKAHGGRGGRGTGRGAGDRRGASGAASNEPWPRLDTTSGEQQGTRGGAFGRGRGRARRGRESASRRGARRASAA